MLKLLLSAAVPFQRFLDEPSPTHGFINRQTLNILVADGRDKEAGWLSRFLTEFVYGCDWADTGWKNVGHMYDPYRGQGLRGWPNAVELAQSYWDQASGHFTANRYGAAFFYLGAAAHLVQDLCVPHHAAVRLFAGHKQFEATARRLRDRYAADRGGLYHLASCPGGWVAANARYTRERHSNCIDGSRRVQPDDLEPAISDLLPRAQRTTAGFLSFFLRQMGVA